MNNGITREEAFTKVLNILEECDAIRYTSNNYKFTRDKLLNALVNTNKNNSTWKLLKYADRSGFQYAINGKVDKEILIKKDGRGRWDIYLLYLIGYRYCSNCDLCYAMDNFYNNKYEKYGKQQHCKICTKVNKKLYRNKTKEHIINVMIREGKLTECSICGYKENWAALDFHHINPELERPKWAKNKKPSQYIFDCSPKEAEYRYLAEINNLEILCCNCHQKHHNIGKRDSKIGLKESLFSLNYDYKCKECNETKYLHLHHNNPKEKEISFDNLSFLSIDKILTDGLLEKEMKKDITILCGNHHREIHNK